MGITTGTDHPTGSRLSRETRDRLCSDPHTLFSEARCFRRLAAGCCRKSAFSPETAACSSYCRLSAIYLQNLSVHRHLTGANCHLLNVNPDMPPELLPPPATTPHHPITGDAGCNPESGMGIPLLQL
jgi:hypothetical protein